MKNDFVADGPLRLLKARAEKRRKAAQAEYASLRVQAVFLERIRLRWLIGRECRQSSPGKTRRQPSPGTWW